MKPKSYIKDDFKNLLDYQNWLKTAFENLSEGNDLYVSDFNEKSFNETIRRRSDWFGKSITYEELANGVKEYQDPLLLEKLYDKVHGEVEQVLAQRIKARKLKFNALGFGMFCFDRAAMTLYRNKEYYSQKLQRPVEQFEIQKTSKGYKLKSDGSPVSERWEQSHLGKPKVRTHTKEVFAYFPEAKRNNHAVEFFISCNASASIRGKDMLYGGISAVIMAEILTKAGIKVKINTVIGSAPDQSRKSFVGSIIPVKHYDEPLDRNLLALMSSDPRFMRYDGFKGIIASYDHFKMTIRPGFGMSMSASELKSNLEDSGYTDKLESAHRYYFGGTFNEKDAIRDITQTIESIANHLER